MPLFAPRVSLHVDAQGHVRVTAVTSETQSDLRVGDRVTAIDTLPLTPSSTSSTWTLRSRAPSTCRLHVERDEAGTEATSTSARVVEVHRVALERVDVPSHAVHVDEEASVLSVQVAELLPRDSLPASATLSRVVIDWRAPTSHPTAMASLAAQTPRYVPIEPILNSFPYAPLLTPTSITSHPSAPLVSSVCLGYCSGSWRILPRPPPSLSRIDRNRPPRCGRVRAQ